MHDPEALPRDLGRRAPKDDPIYDELVALRVTGFRPRRKKNPYPLLTAVALTAYADSDHAKAVREMLKEIVQTMVGSEARRQAIAEVWGLDTTYEEPYAERRRVARDTLGLGHRDDTLKSDYLPGMGRDLAAEVRKLGASATAAQARDQPEETTGTAPQLASDALGSMSLPIRSLLAYCLVLAVAVAAIVGGYPWLAGAAIFAAVTAALSRGRVWRWPLDLTALSMVAVLSVGGGIGTDALYRAIHARQSGRRGGHPARAGTTASTAVPHPGQIVSGKPGYLISNTTEGTAFGDVPTARPCDVLTYRLELYNPGPDPLTDVNVAMQLNTITPYRKFTSTAVAYTPDGVNGETAFQTPIRISAARTQSYVADSTKLINSAGRVVATSASGQLSDAITATGHGIEIGTVGVGVTEYVLIQAKVACDAPSYK